MYFNIDRGTKLSKAKRTEALAGGGLRLIECVVGGTDQRPGLYVLEAHLFAPTLVVRKFVGMDEADYRQMFARRLEVLAEGQDVCALPS
jgi:hypothetical protein